MTQYMFWLLSLFDRGDTFLGEKDKGSVYSTKVSAIV